MLNRGTSFFVSGYLCKVCFQRFRAGGRGCDGERGVFVYSYVILVTICGQPSGREAEGFAIAVGALTYTLMLQWNELASAVCWIYFFLTGLRNCLELFPSSKGILYVG